MKQDEQNRITVAELYFNLQPGNPTFNNLEVFYKNRPVVGVQQGSNGHDYQIEVIGGEGREWLMAAWDDRVTVNVAQAYSGRIELDIER